MSLLNDVKIRLDYTSDDSSSDEKLKSIIEEGKQYLRSFYPLLKEEDFEKPTRAQKLLFHYCRYANSNVVEAFEDNFKSDLLALRQEYEVAAYEAENAD